MNDQAPRIRCTHVLGGLGLLLGALLGGPAAQARPEMGGPPPGPGMELEPRVERMVEQFDLTDEQQARIRTIMENTRKEHERIRQESQQQIDAVLTPEQKAKRTALMEERLDRQVSFMSKRLNLTPEQAGKIKTVLMEQRNNPQLTRAQTRERISEILTPEQRLEFDKGPKPQPGGPDRNGPPDAD